MIDKSAGLFLQIQCSVRTERNESGSELIPILLSKGSHQAARRGILMLGAGLIENQLQVLIKLRSLSCMQASVQELTTLAAKSGIILQQASAGVQTVSPDLICQVVEEINRCPGLSTREDARPPGSLNSS